MSRMGNMGTKRWNFWEKADVLSVLNNKVRLELLAATTLAVFLCLVLTQSNQALNEIVEINGGSIIEPLDPLGIAGVSEISSTFLIVSSSSSTSGSEPESSSSTESTTSESTSTSVQVTENGQVNVTVNGEAVEVPESGRVSETINNANGSTSFSITSSSDAGDGSSDSDVRIRIKERVRH